MSHSHAEIIIPPTQAVEESIEQVMGPFYEGIEGEDRNSHAFWDFWNIGGRWSGDKLVSQYDPDRIKAFYDKLNELKITVSGLRFGKHEISPADQIPAVDALWSDMFPEAAGGCPLFFHYNDPHGSNENGGDVCRVDALPPYLTCATLIIAGPDYADRTKCCAEDMFMDSIWNGVSWQNTAFDGTLGQAIGKHNKQVDGSIDGWRKNERGESADRVADAVKYNQDRRINDDWLVVTVDYHS